MVFKVSRSQKVHEGTMNMPAIGQQKHSKRLNAPPIDLKRHALPHLLSSLPVKIQHSPLPLRPPLDIRTLPHLPRPLQAPLQAVTLPLQALRTIRPERDPEVLLLELLREASRGDHIEDRLAALLRVAVLLPHQCRDGLQDRGDGRCRVVRRHGLRRGSDAGGEVGVEAAGLDD